MLRLIYVLVAGAGLAAAQAFPVTQGKTYKFEKVGDGVYYATGGSGSNNVVIVNQQDVVLVDDGTTPATARALLADIRLLTPNPVRTVINTHFHFDHVDGNQVFGPEVRIIAHENLRETMVNGHVMERDPYTDARDLNFPGQIARLTQRIAAEKDAARRQALSKEKTAVEADLAALKGEVKVTPPNTTYSREMTIYSGAREIRLLFLGRGHTSGDTFVYLPKERIICTGDMEEGAKMPYMGDAYFDEWITTLEALKNIDFALALPGHGVPFRDKSLITAWQSYLKDLIAKGTQLRSQGVSVDDAAKRLDMTAYKKEFPDIAGPGVNILGARRLYQWLGEREKK